MIITALITVVLAVIGVLTSWLPDVTRLPTIGDDLFDTDALFVTGFQLFNKLITDIWWLQIVFQGFVFLMVYYIVMLTLRVFKIYR